MSREENRSVTSCDPFLYYVLYICYIYDTTLTSRPVEVQLVKPRFRRSPALPDPNQAPSRQGPASLAGEDMPVA